MEGLSIVSEKVKKFLSIAKEKVKKVLSANRKTVILIASISAVLLVAFIVLMLFIPTFNSVAFKNTTNEFVRDIKWLAKMESNLAYSGYDADVHVNVPAEITGFDSSFFFTSDIKGYGLEKNRVADINFSFGYNDDVKHSVDFYFDKKTVAIEGISADEPDKVVLLQRDNIIQALEGSIFHPNSGSKYAMDEEEYKRFCDIIKENDNSLNKELEDVYDNIVKRSSKLIETESKYSFVIKEFAIQKIVSSTITQEEIYAIIDIAVEEIEKCDLLKKNLENNDLDIKELSNALKESIPVVEIVLEYTIRGGKITEIQALIKDNSEEFVGETQITAKFNYSKNGCDVTVRGTHKGHEDPYSTQDGFEIKYEKKSSDDITDIRLDLTIDSQGNQEKISTITLNHDKSNNEYIAELTIYEDDIENSYAVCGSFEKYRNNSGLYFTIADYKVDGQTVYSGENDLLTVSLKKDRSAKRLSCPIGIPILSMTEKEIEALTDKLFTEKIAEMYKDLANVDIPRSEEGISVLDSNAWVMADQFVKLLSDYNKYCIYNSLPSTPKAYLYLKQSHIYILAYNNGVTVTVKFYYNPSKTLLEAYHPAEIINGELVVHDYQVFNEIKADCINAGKITYKCSICEGSYSKKTDYAYGHSKVSVKLDHTYDVGQSAEATFVYCSRCNSAIDLYFHKSSSGYSNIHIDNSTSENICHFYSTEKHFILPDDIHKYCDVSNLRFSVNDDNFLLSLRIPDGREIIRENDFVSGKNLQVIVLPNSIKEIEDGAFYAEANIRTIFYIGTESEWKSVKLNAYESLWNNVKIVFTPHGISTEEIMRECVDNTLKDKALSAKKEATQNPEAVKKLTEDNDNVSLVYDGKVSFAAYDSKTDTIIVAEVQGRKSIIHLLSSNGSVKGSFEIDDVISKMDADGGRLAMASSSLSILYFYNISGARLTKYVFKEYDCKFIELFVDEGRVIFVAKKRNSTREDLYILSTNGNLKKIEGIINLTNGLYFIKDDHKIIHTDWTNSQIHVIDTVSGGVKKTVYLSKVKTNRLMTDGYMYIYEFGSSIKEYFYYDINLAKSDTRPEPYWTVIPLDHYSLEIKSVVTSSNGRAAMVINREGDISVVIRGATSHTNTVIDYYAESGYFINNGKVMLFTPGGYGIVLVSI